jgi:hypothetical protein
MEERTLVSMLVHTSTVLSSMKDTLETGWAAELVRNTPTGK